MLPIEIISHLSRVLSLSLRLFGNIFGEDLVILILFSIVPFLVPLPMMFLGIITASLQAFIFVLLTTIYLGGRGGDRARAARARRQWPQGKSRDSRIWRNWRIGDFSGGDVSRSFLSFGMMMLAAVAFVSPLHAQEAAAAAAARRNVIAQWSIITAGFALAIAAAFGALSQAKGLSAAVEGIARNPSAAGEIRGNLILGLVLIESLVIYVLLISLILFFVVPF